MIKIDTSFCSDKSAYDFYIESIVQKLIPYLHMRDHIGWLDRYTQIMAKNDYAYLCIKERGGMTTVSLEPVQHDDRLGNQLTHDWIDRHSYILQMVDPKTSENRTYQ